MPEGGPFFIAAFGGVAENDAQLGEAGGTLLGQGFGGVAAHGLPLLKDFALGRVGGVGPVEEGLLVFVGQERQVAGFFAQGVDFLEVQVAVGPRCVKQRKHRLYSGGKMCVHLEISAHRLNKFCFPK